MNSTTMGAMITSLRCQKNCSRNKLCQGLCSTQMLIKIENDEADIDKFMLDMLLQRLGKSPDKLEVILSDDEYEKIYQRDYIEELIWKSKKDEAIALLETYANDYAKESNVQKMFVLRTRAYISRNIDHDVQMAELYIRQAIEVTLPGLNSTNMNKYLLAENELENLLELSRCLLEQQRCEEAGEILIACQHYIEANVSDEAEYAKLIGKLVWLLADIHIEKGTHLQAYQICENALESMRKYGNLYFMMPVMEKLIYCSEILGLYSERNKWKRYYDVLSEVYRDYGETWHCQDSLFHNSKMTVYHLMSEFIRQERQAQELTQEQLIEGVYESPENLSRIENGKVIPSRKRFEGLMVNLGIERGKYCGTAVVESFEILELKYEIDILLGEDRYEEAQDCLKRLRRMLDYNKKINSIGVEIYQIIIDRQTGKIDASGAYDKCRELLEDSFLMKNGQLQRVPFFNELLVLNLMCSNLNKLGKYQEATIFYEEIIKSVKESKIATQYQSEIMSIALANIGLHDKNEARSKEGVAYELACGKGKMIYMHFISQLSEENSNEKNKKLAYIGYYLADLFYRGVNKQKISEYYEKSFGEQLI